jgi:signal transduction histidine kinase
MFNHASIKRKLTFIIMLTAGIALALACGGFIAYELLTYRQILANEMTSLAGIIGTNSTAALAFNDPGAAENTLAILKTEPRILSAAIYQRNGQLFAAYRRPDRRDSPLPAVSQGESYRLEKDHMVVSRDVQHDGRPIGLVCLQSDLQDLRARLQRYLLIIVAVFLVSIAVALWISSRLQRMISDPLLHLAGVARTVTTGKDYGLRAAPPNTRDELRTLVEGFNEMLDQIQRRDAELRKAHDELERRVEERTADLEQEIAVRKKAEAGLKAFADKLERSNRELQDFAHVASHDLQEPLRKVQAFGDRLQTKYADALTAEGCDYLSRMQNAAVRMQDLINGLLAFSRVTTKAQPFARVDLAAVAREVLADLEIRIEQTGGRVECRDLPAIEADPLQMRQLMQNLIGNALKFHRPDAAPVVRVSGSRADDRPGPDTSPAPPDGFCRIVVEDNGVGFDPRYRDRLFNVFQRLHTRAEFEGTGIGLAVCRKIVERHGGSIEADSTPGEGARFTVRLPVRQTKGDSPGLLASS